MTVVGGLARRGHENQLGLVPFLVPGWPSGAVFVETVDAIARAGCAGWEIAIPGCGWSAATSCTIASALSQTHIVLGEVLSIAQRLRPNIAVLYRQTIEEWGRERLLDQLVGHFDHVMLEAPDDNGSAWTESCVGRGLGWVEVRQAITLGAEQARRLADRLPPGSVIYLTAASATGQEAGSFTPLARAVANIRERREDLVVTTGFGISTAAQVQRLATIDGLDAVAIGTALLQHQVQGSQAAGAYYAGLHKSAGKRVSHALP